MKKNIYSLISWILLFVIILGFNTNIYAMEIGNDYILELDKKAIDFKGKQYDINQNKEWTIKFNQIVSQESVTEENIFIWNKSTKETVNCFVDTYGDIITIYPKLGYFSPDTDYILYITDNVKSITGKMLSHPIKMEFKTSKDTYTSNAQLVNFNTNKDVAYINDGDYILFRVSLIGETNQKILLFECDENNNVIDLVGEMKDSGDADMDGDDAKGDNIYSYKYQIGDTQETIKYFAAKLENETEEQKIIIHVIESISDVQAEEAMEIAENSNDYFNFQLGIGDFEQAKEETIKWLEKQENVVEVESSNENIVYLLNSNIIGAIIPEKDDINGYKLQTNDTYNADETEDITDTKNIKVMENMIDDIDIVENEVSTTDHNILKLEDIREQYRKKAEEKIKTQVQTVNVENNQILNTSDVLGNYSVLLTSPSHDEFSKRTYPTNFEDDLIVIFEQYPDNFNITTKYDNDAGLECYKNLGSYDIITINTHGGVLKSKNIFHIIFGTSKKNGIVIQKTGEKVTPSKQKQYEKDLKTGRLLILGDNYFGISPEFISQYNINFQNSIIYSAICESAYNDTMSDAYLNNGASVYLGYDESVLGLYTHDIAKSLFSNLINNMSVSESMNSAINEYGENDVEYSKKKFGSVIIKKIPAKLLLKGDGSFGLFDKKMSIINGDFEKGTLIGWSYLHDCKVVTRLGELKPTQGKYMGMISTGLGTQIESDSHIEQKIYIPNDAKYLSFDYNVVSEEYPVFTYEETFYDDTFEVYLDGDVICYESAGTSTWYPITGMDFSSGDGTFGHTGWKHKIVNVEKYRGKFVDLKFRIWDVGDSIYDSAAIIDNIKIQYEEIPADKTITSSQIETAIAWATKKMNNDDGTYINYCLKFVGDAWKQANITTKSYGWAKLAADDMVKYSDKNPPRGAVVFYDYYNTIGGTYRNWGHVAISLGNGKIIHALNTGIKITNIDMGSNMPYLGWGVWDNRVLATTPIPLETPGGPEEPKE